MRLVASPAPPDSVDLFLDLEGLEVVKFGLMRLKLCVELVFAALFGVAGTLEKDNAAALVASREVVTGM